MSGVRTTLMMQALRANSPAGSDHLVPGKRQSVVLGLLVAIVLLPLLCTCCGGGGHARPTETIRSWTLSGVISDTDNQPLAGATALISLFHFVVTDSTGSYQLSLGPFPDSDREIAFACPGYRDTLVAIGKASVTGEHQMQLHVRLRPHR